MTNNESINVCKNSKLFQEKYKLASLALLLICCVGLFRIIHINHSFWLDEITTSWVVGGKFSDIFTRCWINNLSPLYYIFIYFSKILFGYTEYSLRVPGVITGILTIPIIYGITYKLNKSIILSLFAAFITSIDFWLVYYSLEVRPYSFVILFSSIHIYLFILFLQKNNKLFYATLLGLLSGFIILLNYTAATLCITEFFIAIYYFNKEKLFSVNTIYGLLIYLLIPIAMLLPFSPHIIYLFKNKTLLGSFIEEQDIFSIFEIFPHFINYMLLPLIISFFVEYFKRENANNNTYTFELFFVLSWYFIPILIHWVLTDMNIVHIFRDRYLAWIMPAPIIGSIILIKNLQSQSAKITFIIIMMLLTVSDYFPNLNMQFFNSILEKNYQQDVGKGTTYGEFGWKEAVNFLNNSKIEINKIYVISGLVESKMLHMNQHDKNLLKSYLLSPVNSIYKLNQSYLNISEPIISVDDIPDADANYIVIGSPVISRKNIELSPKDNATVHIYYIY